RRERQSDRAEGERATRQGRKRPRATWSRGRHLWRVVISHVGLSLSVARPLLQARKLARYMFRGAIGRIVRDYDLLHARVGSLVDGAKHIGSVSRRILRHFG